MCLSRDAAYVLLSRFIFVRTKFKEKYKYSETFQFDISIYNFYSSVKLIPNTNGYWQMSTTLS